QISEDTHLAALDHVLAEAQEIARARASGIDCRGDPRPPAELLRVDPERRPTPVNMRMQIDESRRDDSAGYVANVGIGIGFQFQSDARHLALRECDISHRIQLL